MFKNSLWHTDRQRACHCLQADLRWWRNGIFLPADSLQKQEETEVIGGQSEPCGIAAPTVIPVSGRRHSAHFNP